MRTVDSRNVPNDPHDTLHAHALGTEAPAVLLPAHAQHGKVWIHSQPPMQHLGTPARGVIFSALQGVQATGQRTAELATIQYNVDGVRTQWVRSLCT
jgi:hypothetical protein